jgi:hypothetical protein
MKLKIIPNPNGEMYNQVSESVKENEGYCPCMLEKDEDTKCICKDFREQNFEGLCHCGRFIKVKM